jgi:hypothetical protein
MALGSSLTLSKDTATDVDTNTTVFVLRAADLDQSVYSKAGLTSPAESKLTVKHETGKGGEGRHLIRHDQLRSMRIWCLRRLVFILTLSVPQALRSRMPSFLRWSTCLLTFLSRVAAMLT